VNPCLTAAISAASFSPASIQVTHGSVGTAAYTVAADAVDTATGVTGYCGTRSYTVDDAGSSIAWATVDTTTTTGSVTLTVNSDQYPTVPTTDVIVTLTVTTTMDAWPDNPGRTDTIDVTIAPLGCDCTPLAWDAPTATSVSVAVEGTATAAIINPDANTSARSSNFGFDNCYDQGGTCELSGAITSLTLSDGSALPAFIIFVSSGAPQ
jgi:hypothetical protein